MRSIWFDKWYYKDNYYNFHLQKCEKGKILQQKVTKSGILECQFESCGKSYSINKNKNNYWQTLDFKIVFRKIINQTKIINK